MPACGADGLSSACWLAILLKYSKARRWFCATPSPRAYIRPSFHCATGWPPSAAYSSAITEEDAAFVDAGTAAVGTEAGGTGRLLSGGDVTGWGETTPSGAVGLTGALTGVPSNPNAGANGRAPRTNASMVRLDVRITLFLVCATWVGNRPIHRRPNLLSILPQRTRRVVSRARGPFGLAFSQFRGGQFYVKTSGLGVDLDDVAVQQQRDRPANGRFRPDMADAEAAGGAG